MLDIAHLAKGDGVPCLECGANILIGIPEDAEDERWTPLDDGDFVSPNRTFPDSTGFVGVCAVCLKHFAPSQEIQFAVFDKCLVWKGPRDLCFRPILVLVNKDKQFRSFGGRIDFKPIGSIYASGQGNICNHCLKKLGLMAKLRLFLRHLLNSMRNEFLEAIG